jgi:hypothetical protein
VQLAVTLAPQEPSPSETPTETPSGEPLPTREQLTELNSKVDDLNSQAVGARDLYLYSAGLLIFLTAVIAWRSRRS